MLKLGDKVRLKVAKQSVPIPFKYHLQTSALTLIQTKYIPLRKLTIGMVRSCTHVRL